MVNVLDHFVGIIIIDGIEPHIYDMLSLNPSSYGYFSMDNVGLVRLIPQEFEVYLVVISIL
jgi:hypothetical protein